MLSRVANSLYWLGRQVERAENLARLIDVVDQSLLDSEMNADDQFRYLWHPVLAATAQDAKFQEMREGNPELTAIEFCTMTPSNTGSILKCVSAARENARMVRDQISDELWRELNRLHLYLLSAPARTELEDDSQAFFSRVRRASLLIQGISDSTVPHSEGWNFMRLGRYLERADQTSRILDIMNRIPNDGSNRHAVSWGTILKASSAIRAHRMVSGSIATRESVVELMVFSRSFPRSIGACLGMVDEALHAISGTASGYFSNEPERLTGGVMARLNFGSVSDAVDRGLDTFLYELQNQFFQIGQTIFESYVLMPRSVISPKQTQQ